MTGKVKAIIAGAAVLVVAAVAGYFVFSGGDSYCSAIPKGVAVLGRVDAAQLVKDNDIDVKALIEKTGLKAEDTDAGLDLASPIYYFADAEHLQFGLVMRLDDASKFKIYVETQGQKNGLGKVETARGLQWVQLDTYAMAVWDDDRLLVMGGRQADDMRNVMAEYMGQSKKESVMSTPIYDELQDAKEALTLFVDGEQVDAAVENSGDNSMRQLRSALAVARLRDVHLKFALDVKDNYATLSSDLLPQSDEAKEYYERMYDICDDIDGDLIDRGLTNPTLWVGANIDGEKFAEYLSNVDEARAALALIESQVSVRDMLKAFDGDLSFALDATHGKERNPDMLFIARTSDNAPIEAATECPLLRFQKLADGTYAAPVGYNQQVFLGTNRKGFYVTNKEALTHAADQSARGLDDLKKEIKHSTCYATLDLQQVVSVFMQDRQTQAFCAYFKDELATLERLTLRGAKGHAELTLRLTKGTNLVKTLQQAAEKAQKYKTPTPTSAAPEPEPDYDETALDEYGY